MGKVRCKYLETCVFIKDQEQKNEERASLFKRQYCEAGERIAKQCKRYIIKEKLGYCPKHLVPNTQLTIDEILVGLNTKV